MAADAGGAVVLAETSDAYRVIDQDKGFFGALSHTAALVEKQIVRLVKLPGPQFQLHMVIGGTPQAQEVQPVILDGDWDILPPSVDEIVRQVCTLKAPGDTTADVLANGEFEGEDIPLFQFEIKRKSHGWMERLMNPNTALPDHPEGEPRLVRLAFEEKIDAQEWYALVALCCGEMGGDDSALQGLPLASSQSKSIVRQPVAAAAATGAGN